MTNKAVLALTARTLKTTIRRAAGPSRRVCCAARPSACRLRGRGTAFCLPPRTVCDIVADLNNRRTYLRATRYRPGSGFVEATEKLIASKNLEDV